MLFAMHSTGEPGRPPVKVGVAATDIATGLYAHGAIMAALISRQQTNKGVWIDCNLFESQVIISYSVIQKDTVNYRLSDCWIGKYRFQLPDSWTRSIAPRDSSSVYCAV
jgi:crotonobetainyl-CoA:carnitine CoA-transferase CaiB-like acyl-CoA transferase